ncbi:hypothetical protein CLV62_101162 [Dysgonomonas alginatilytica]|uniref:Uncharacterized protein n=1 Tax=Dysgonomonas alginatilytica TaxID=1605892 RepID=A0A2V3PVG7_9BACT|nr:hypothetical protein [Dysgonomonas alginatilytica]PXV68896.1 hypothetical protein CLV62_101162 [Dysgonomonas alginatilytica]
MKRYLFLMAFACLSYQLLAQIGINTESPQQLLHVDAKGNTSANSNVSDDVVIDKSGKVGVGVLSPTAKLHIETTVSLPAIHLADGSEGDGKILGSKDANGNMTWLTPPTSWTKVVNFTGGLRNYLNGYSALLLSVQLPESGNYIVMLRWWGTANTSFGLISAYLNIKEGVNNVANDAADVNKDNIEYYIKYPQSGAPFSFTSYLRGSFTANKWLKLYISPSTPMPAGQYSWTIGNTTSKELNPTVIILKI